MHLGFYSLVQFHRDPFRREGVNVGVIVVSEDLRLLRVRFVETSERVRRMCPGVRIDDAGLSAAKRALARRLSEVEPTEEALRSFIRKESSQLVILPPLRARVENLEATIARLFDEFVADPAPMPNVMCPQCGFAFDPAASVLRSEDWRRHGSALRPNAPGRVPAWLLERASPPALLVTPLAGPARSLASVASPAHVLTSLSLPMGALGPHRRLLGAVSQPVATPQSNVFEIAHGNERIWS